MDPLLAPIPGAEHQEVASVQVDVARAGRARIKRLVYPPGFRWSTHMKPMTGTELCEHAHVGYLARGRVRGHYADGCAFDLSAPQLVVITPGHDAWVEGSEPAVLIQFDAERDTLRLFGLPDHHQH